ncbi:hypothetical protein PBOI14_21710 [Pseudomonas sp. Boi14]|nr:hypothetical protein PBOI14_21710 [Pseudomonas sp. Boi14]
MPGSTRLILLDPQSLDWRLQDPLGPPTLVLRISRLQAQQRLVQSPHPRLSLLWSDPPLERQLRLIRSVLPQVRRVGVLYSSDSRFLLKELHLAAQTLNMEIIAEPWDSTSDSRPLQNLLRNSEVLLGLDDPKLYNPKTVKNLLLSSYARQQALIGPMPASSGPAAWPAPTATSRTGCRPWTACSTNRRPAGPARYTRRLSKY